MIPGHCESSRRLGELLMLEQDISVELTSCSRILNDLTELSDKADLRHMNVVATADHLDY